MRNTTAEEVESSNQSLETHEFVLMIEDSYNEQSLQVAEEDRMEEPSMAKRMVVWNPQFEHDDVNIRKRSAENPQCEVFVHFLLGISNGAKSGCCNCMRENGSHRGCLLFVWMKLMHTKGKAISISSVKESNKVVFLSAIQYEFDDRLNL